VREVKDAGGIWTNIVAAWGMVAHQKDHPLKYPTNIGKHVFDFLVDSCPECTQREKFPTAQVKSCMPYQHHHILIKSS